MVHPSRLIQQRVGGFVFSLNILPIVGVLFVLAANELTLWYLQPFCMVLILALCVFAACYAGKPNRYAESFGKLEEGLLMELLSIRHVSKSFLDHDSTVHAVTDVSLDIFPGEMIAIIGPPEVVKQHF